MSLSDQGEIVDDVKYWENETRGYKPPHRGKGPFDFDQSVESDDRQNIFESRSRGNSTGSVDLEVEDDDESSIDGLDGEWVECRELSSGQIVFYNKKTMQVTLDPNKAELLTISENNPLDNSSKLSSDVFTAQDASMLKTSEQLVQRLTIWSIEADTIIKQTSMSDDVRDRVDDIRKQIDNLINIIEEEEEFEDKDDVEALVSALMSKWNFDNTAVDAYRARALEFPHHAIPIQDYTFPQYYSKSPIPSANQAPISCDVLLPEHLAKQQENGFIRITLKPDSTANQVIDQVFKKLPSSIKQTDYVLKGLGLWEYFDGDDPMYFYETIRSYLRRREIVQIVLVPYPKTVQDNGENKEYIETYKKKVNRNLPVLTMSDHIAPQDQNIGWQNMDVFYLSKTKWPWRIKLIGADHVNPISIPRIESCHTKLYFKSFLFHGLHISSASQQKSRHVDFSEHPRWSDFMKFDQNDSIMLDTIPREARIAFLLCTRSVQDEEVILSWVVVPLIDEFGHLVRGRHTLKMWPLGIDVKEETIKSYDFILRGTTRDNEQVHTNILPPSVSVEFDRFALPVVSSLREALDESVPSTGEKTEWRKLAKKLRNRIDYLVQVDSLYELTRQDKEDIWATRHHILKMPMALPKFLQSVNWFDVTQRMEAYRLLDQWEPPTSAISMIELLDAKYASFVVREYAVRFLKTLPDDELRLFILQLIQCLKFESYHDNPLTRLLIERARSSPFNIGHHMYWHMKAESIQVEFAERYACILEEYLSFAGPHTKELRKQSDAVHKLMRISDQVVTMKRRKEKTDSEITKIYHEKLNNLNDRFFSKVGTIQLPLDPKWKVTELIVEKCRYMSSKMAPLWLVFKNADPQGSDIYVIFKTGDDLRQDILTLQLLQVMDKIWMSENLDLRLTPYKCVATGWNVQGKGAGMIEVVLDSDTTSGIQLKYGGALGALRLEPLDKYLQEHNSKEEDVAIARENFLRSCAGYCVATYVLGIGDRHNGNIMMTKDGHLFHIDFGHILGNFKSKFGIKRERAAFVLTPEMAYVMGGKRYKKAKNFQRFEDMSQESFVTLRRHANLFINMFILMVPAGMPELLFARDVQYLEEKLMLSASEKDAVHRLRKEIRKSLSTTYRSIDNFIHNLKHG